MSHIDMDEEAGPIPVLIVVCMFVASILIWAAILS